MLDVRTWPSGGVLNTEGRLYCCEYLRKIILLVDFHSGKRLVDAKIGQSDPGP